MKASQTIDDYIAQFPNDVGQILANIRELIKILVPDAIEAMAYGIPTFKYGGKNLVHFAGYKHHIGIYPTPHILDEYEAELRPYRSGKGTAQFPLNENIPYDLIRTLVQARVTQIQKNQK